MLSSGERDIIEKPYLLLVEGPEDKKFFEALIDHLKLSEVQILSYGGKDNLRSYLKALVISPNFHSTVKSVGITRDADKSPKSALQSIQDALVAAELPAPKSCLQPIGQKPKVIIRLLPDGNNPGKLETLCLKSVEQDPAISCVDKYFECLKKENLPLPKDLEKAKVHAFLASRQRPDLRLGDAAKAGYWPWQEKVFDQIKNFLNQLCS